MRKRFVIHDSSIEECVESLENKNTRGKTKQDVKLLNDFLRGEEKERARVVSNYSRGPLAELIRSVRRKDGGEYEPSSLRSLLASVERHLKKNSYLPSIFSDRLFELTRRCLESKQKRKSKKQAVGTRTKLLPPLTNQEIDVLYEINK